MSHEGEQGPCDASSTSNSDTTLAAVESDKPRVWQPWNFQEKKEGQTEERKDLPSRIWKVRRMQERQLEPLGPGRSGVHHHIPPASRERGFRHSHGSYSSIPSVSEDGPLDMRVKQRVSEDEDVSTSNRNSSDECVETSAVDRPSVIMTCASSRKSMSPPQYHDHHHHLSSCSSSEEDASESVGGMRISSSDTMTPPPPPPPPKREVFTSIEGGSECCDPVIDEHFRRSLGSKYQHVFSSHKKGNSSSSSSSPVVSSTSGDFVDDHFAKALGETWLRLQEQGKEQPTTTTRTSPELLIT
ncbi:unnamed protein product [Darwinula stevensoni]|uniref:Transcription cofactor vestigial-like protein 4 n=1 Tax=Darwinula stevensoni TaxID=69355 RepID=A0A7R9ABC9_9CRUS|nr:unnamed protein product [Darwinula stevensoni]CAG0899103.1 unnamed protein product [Darwinula stevensoni]